MSTGLRGRLFPALLVVGLAALLAPEGFAAQTIYLKAEGATQGWIQGESMVTSLERQDTIEVYELHHLILNEAGKKKHEPVVFTRRIDKASVPLYRALDTGELLTLQFRFYRPTPSGAEELFYTISLRNAWLTAIEPVTRSNLEQQSAQLPHMERLRATYQQMVITYEIGGASVTLINPAP